VDAGKEKSATSYSGNPPNPGNTVRLVKATNVVIGGEKTTVRAIFLIGFFLGKSGLLNPSLRAKRSNP
jgi:hypothetical protein